MRLHILTIGIIGLLFAACASTPEPEPQPVRQDVQAPRVITPQPQPRPQTVAPPVQVEQFVPPTPGSVEDFIYQVGGDARIYFGYDQFTLTAQAREVLRAQASWLQQYPRVQAVIEGNADERGTREYNLALGGRRADSVKAFLVSQGVSPGRLTTISYGKERPIDPRSNEQAWSRNRNALTNILTDTIG